MGASINPVLRKSLFSTCALIFITQWHISLHGTVAAISTSASACGLHGDGLLSKKSSAIVGLEILDDVQAIELEPGQRKNTAERLVQPVSPSREGGIQQRQRYHFHCDTNHLKLYKRIVSSVQRFLFQSFVSRRRPLSINRYRVSPCDTFWFLCFSWSSSNPRLTLRHAHPDHVKGTLNGATAGGSEDHYYGPFLKKDEVQAAVTSLREIFLLQGEEKTETTDQQTTSMHNLEESRKRRGPQWGNAEEYHLATTLAEELWIGHTSESSPQLRNICHAAGVDVADSDVANVPAPVPLLSTHLAACSDGVTRATFLIEGLQQVQQMLGLPRLPRRIEGYDVSHIQGYGAVASRSVLIDGEPASNLYRWYRITNETVRIGHSDDYASLAEMITARFAGYAQRREDPTVLGGKNQMLDDPPHHEDDGTVPDLLLIDGGKGQLSAVVNALQALKMSPNSIAAGAEGLNAKGLLKAGPAVAALAKQREEVFVPDRTEPVEQPPGGRNSPGLLLLQQCRDEAHAFAVYYHRHVRSTEYLRSAFDGVDGMSKAQRRLLLERFGSIAAVNGASIDELASTEGIDRDLACRVYTHFHRNRECAAELRQVMNTEKEIPLHASNNMLDVRVESVEIKQTQKVTLATTSTKENELSKHSGGRFATSTLLLSGRQNQTQVSARTRVLRSGRQWIMERSLHLHRIATNMTYADGVFAAMHKAMLALLPQHLVANDTEGLKNKSVEMSLDVHESGEAKADRSFLHYLPKTPDVPGIEVLDTYNLTLEDGKISPRRRRLDEAEDSSSPVKRSRPSSELARHSDELSPEISFANSSTLRDPFFSAIETLPDNSSSKSNLISKQAGAGTVIELAECNSGQLLPSSGEISASAYPTQNCVDPDDMLRSLAKLVFNGSAPEVLPMEPYFDYKRCRQRLFGACALSSMAPVATDKQGNCRADENNGSYIEGVDKIAADSEIVRTFSDPLSCLEQRNHTVKVLGAAILVCDHNKRFDVLDAETALEQVDRWFSAQSRISVDGSEVLASKATYTGPRGDAIDDGIPDGSLVLQVDNTSADRGSLENMSNSANTSKCLPISFTSSTSLLIDNVNAKESPRASFLGMQGSDVEIAPGASVLSFEQLRAVEAPIGPVLVLAGPGSGKTRVLTHRIMHLMETTGAPASAFLALTFTNKAAAELRIRLAGLLHSTTPKCETELAAGTFHSVCVGLLRRYGSEIGISPRFSVYGADEQKQVMTNVLGILSNRIGGLGTVELTANIALTILSRLRADAHDGNIQEVAWHGGHRLLRDRGERFRTALRMAYDTYTAMLERSNALDFDQILLKTVKLLASRQAVLDEVRAKWKHILVDEWQDTNPVQFSLVKFLVDPATGSVFAVGDADQSIYSWRGADSGNVKRFITEFGIHSPLTLEDNYRSTKAIAAAAQTLIERGETATSSKTKRTIRSMRQQGIPVHVYAAWDDRDEADFVSAEICRLIATGQIRSHADAGIMYRTNAQSRAIEESFVRNGVSHRVLGAARFFDRKEVKDIVAYLKVIYNHNDSASLQRILNVPPRGIGEVTQTRLVQYSISQNCSLWDTIEVIMSDQSVSGQSAREVQVAKTKLELPRKQLVAVAEFDKLLVDLTAAAKMMRIADLIRAILETTRFQASLGSGAEGKERLSNILELQRSAERYSTSGEAALGAFLEDVALMGGPAMEDDEIAKGQAGTSGAQASLMTIHASKGLEFRVAFMVGMEDGSFPHERCLKDSSEMEEERRLAYVGFTRAQDILYLTHRRRPRMIISSSVKKNVSSDQGAAFESASGFRPSRFLLELPTDVIRHVGKDGTVVPKGGSPRADRILLVWTNTEPDSAAQALLQRRGVEVISWAELGLWVSEQDSTSIGTVNSEAKVAGVGVRDAPDYIGGGLRNTHLSSGGNQHQFGLSAPYSPKGDQQPAIDILVEGLSRGRRFQTLVGATGTGKTFVMANVIARFGRPVLVLAPNKILAAQLVSRFPVHPSNKDDVIYRQLCSELKGFFPHNSVEYFVSYYDFFRPEAYLAVRDVHVDKVSVVNDDIDRLRHAATRALLERKDTIVVSSVSCIYGLGLPAEYLRRALRVTIGDNYNIDRLSIQLEELHYIRVDLGLPNRGQFVFEDGFKNLITSQRLKTLILGPAHTQQLIHIQLQEILPDFLAADVAIISICQPSTFRVIKITTTARPTGHPTHNVTSEVAAAAGIAANECMTSHADLGNPDAMSCEGTRTLQNRETDVEESAIVIYPASHFVAGADSTGRILGSIRSELAARIVELEEAGLWAEAQRLVQRCEGDLLQIESIGYCRGIENYARHLAGRASGEPPDCLLDYFPTSNGELTENGIAASNMTNPHMCNRTDGAGWLLLVDESHLTVPQIRGMYYGDRARKETLVRHGFRLPSALDNRPLRDDEFWARIPHCIFVSATPGDWELRQSRLCAGVVNNSLKDSSPSPEHFQNREGDGSIESTGSPIWPQDGRAAELVIRPTGILDPIVEVRPAAGQVDDLLVEILARVSRKERTLVAALTKKAAEEMAEHGVKAAWLHSEVKSVARLEILRDLRSGVFDVLVGVNLLREGLDLPEVSLVAIMDADKEGFLRSDKSLIQTMGRAARHVNGTVILYCEAQTGSMRRALEETSRRRDIQRQYNADRGLIPTPLLGGAVGNRILDLVYSSRARDAEAAQEASLSPDETTRRTAGISKRKAAARKDATGDPVIGGPANLDVAVPDADTVKGGRKAVAGAKGRPAARKDATRNPSTGGPAGNLNGAVPEANAVKRGRKAAAGAAKGRPLAAPRQRRRDGVGNAGLAAGKPPSPRGRKCRRGSPAADVGPGSVPLRAGVKAGEEEVGGAAGAWNGVGGEDGEEGAATRSGVGVGDGEEGAATRSVVAGEDGEEESAAAARSWVMGGEGGREEGAAATRNGEAGEDEGEEEGAAATRSGVMGKLLAEASESLLMQVQALGAGQV